MRRNEEHGASACSCCGSRAPPLPPAAATASKRTASQLRPDVAAGGAADARRRPAVDGEGAGLALHSVLRNVTNASSSGDLGVLQEAARFEAARFEQNVKREQKELAALAEPPDEFDGEGEGAEVGPPNRKESFVPAAYGAFDARMRVLADRWLAHKPLDEQQRSPQTGSRGTIEEPDPDRGSSIMSGPSSVHTLEESASSAGSLEVGDAGSVISDGGSEVTSVSWAAMSDCTVSSARSSYSSIGGRSETCRSESTCNDLDTVRETDSVYSETAPVPGSANASKKSRQRKGAPSISDNPGTFESASPVMRSASNQRRCSAAETAVSTKDEDLGSPVELIWMGQFKNAELAARALPKGAESQLFLSEIVFAKALLTDEKGTPYAKLCSETHVCPHC